MVHIKPVSRYDLGKAQDEKLFLGFYGRILNTILCKTLGKCDDSNGNY